VLAVATAIVLLQHFERATKVRLAGIATQFTAMLLLADWAVWTDVPRHLDGSADHQRVGPGLILVCVATFWSALSLATVGLDAWTAKPVRKRQLRSRSTSAFSGSKRTKSELYIE
jgi:hypothetical protein